jgi:flagellar biogenesis protein FliO
MGNNGITSESEHLTNCSLTVLGKGASVCIIEVLDPTSVLGLH